MKFESLRRHSKLIILASICGAFFCSQVFTAQTSPKTYYVAKAGFDTNPGTFNAPFLTIKQCVRVLVAGDTCLVRGGKYNEHFLNIGIGYTAVGTSWNNPITLKAYSGEPVTVENIAEDSIMIFNGSKSNDLYWIVDGFVFDGSTSWRCCASVGGLVGGGGRNVRIQNSEIKNGASHGILAGGANWQLLNLNVHDNGLQAGSLPLHGIYWTGIQLLIEGGAYHDNTGFGIHIFDSGSISVNDNTVRNTLVYSNNKQRGVGGGIILSTGFNNSAYNNLIYSNGADGLNIDYRCNGCSAFNNTIYNNSSWGMQIGINNSASNSRVQNNIVFGNLNPIRDRGTNTFASNNMITDPFFVDTSKGDFSLLFFSNAIGAGANLSSIFTWDITGKPRPASGAWDLGAYTYVPPSSSPSLKATFTGTPGQDYVGAGNQLSPNGRPDWNIHLQGMRSSPVKVRITSSPGGIWETPFNGANWIVLLQDDRAGNGDLWFEPWTTASGIHVKLWYADGTTDEVDTVNGGASLPAFQATFLGVTGEDVVGTTQLAPDGKSDWHIRLQGLTSTPVKVRISNTINGVWEYPFNGYNYTIYVRPDGQGNADLWFPIWNSPAPFHVKVWYADTTTAEVDVH